MKNLFSLIKGAAVAAAVCLFTSSAAFAGPFGSNMGDKVELYPGARSFGNGTYTVTTMPESDAIYSWYMLNFAQDGLSAVSAFADGDDVQKDLLSLFTSTMEKLIAQYGAPAETLDPFWTDFLNHGHNLQELQTALYENAHLPFGAAWDVKDDASGIASAQLVLLPATATRSAVIVSYFYKNYVEEKAPAAE